MTMIIASPNVSIIFSIEQPSIPIDVDDEIVITVLDGSTLRLDLELRLRQL